MLENLPQLMDKVWIIPAIMASSFLIILLFGKRFSERVTSGIGILAVLVCFGLSLVVAGNWINRVNNPPTGDHLATALSVCHAVGGEHGTTEGEATTEPAGGSTEHGLGAVEGESAAVRQEGETPASGGA